MAWTFNGIRIFVQDYGEEGNQIIPRLQPLAGGTTLQIFGYESAVKSLSAIVVGNSDKDALMSYRSTGLAYSLVGPEGSIGTFYVKNVSVSRLLVLCQTIRTDLDEDAPVYTVEMQLYGA